MGCLAIQSNRWSNWSDDEWIAVAVLSGLLRLAQHARDSTAASGNWCGPSLHLFCSATTAHSLEIGPNAAFTGSPESRSEYCHRSAFTAIQSRGRRATGQPGLSRGFPELIAVAAALIDEIGQAFGIAEMGQLVATMALSAAAIGIGASKLLPGLSGIRSMTEASAAKHNRAGA